MQEALDQESRDSHQRPDPQHQPGEVHGPPADSSELLYRCVTANQVSQLQQLLRDGASADTFYDDDANISSKSILHIACGKGHADCIRALLEAGAMIDSHDSWGQTPLHYCISMQFIDCAQTVLDLCGDRLTDIIDNQDCFGKSCLHAAAESGNIEAIQLLLEHGANVNVRNFDGITPLMVCADVCGRQKSVRSMEILIEAGAIIDLTEFRSRRTALQRAAVARNVKGVELLLSVGAEVDTLDITRRTPLTNIMWDHVRNRQGVCNIDADVMTIIVLLAQGGADLDLGVCEYSNPLVTAAFLQAAPLIHFLLDQGATPNITFKSGVTPLLVATTKKDVNCVKTMLSYNSCMTTKGKIFRKRLNAEFTFDPMEMALDDNSFQLVQLFLAAGYPSNNIRDKLLDKLRNDKPPIDLDLEQWLVTRVSCPPSMRDLSVFCVRQRLGLQLHSAVPLLPLPSLLRQAVMLEDQLELPSTHFSSAVNTG